MCHSKLSGSKRIRTFQPEETKLRRNPSSEALRRLLDFLCLDVSSCNRDNWVSREGSTIEIGRFLQNTYSEDMVLMGNIKGTVSASETLNGAREIT